MHQAGLTAPERAGPPAHVVPPEARATMAEQRSGSRTDSGLEQHAAWHAPGEGRADSPNRPINEHVQSQPSAAPAQAQESRPQPSRASDAYAHAQPPSQSTDHPAAVGEANHSSGDEHIQPAPLPAPSQGQQPRASEPRAGAQPASESRNSGANPSAAVERMRPPAPPTFNQWRGQQQSRPSETQPGSQPVRPQAGRIEPAAGASTGRAEQRNLPGEPAMRLRPPAAATGSNQHAQASGCRPPECR